MSETYTIADLQAMPDDALNALAAELRWQKEITWDIWSPTSDRNQSGELLQWAEAHRGCAFDIQIGRNEAIGIFIPPNATRFPDVVVSGNDARAETIAFCAAMLAMKGRLK